MEKVALIIPCFNEEKTIEKVVMDFITELPELEIYVYNNNSTDNTYNILNNKKLPIIVRNEFNQGKGNVVRRMFREVNADIYVMVDGDDTYSAKDIKKLIEPIKNGTADMVVGDRITSGAYKKENKRRFHEFGNNLVKKMINTLFKSNLQDVMSGYRAFNKVFVKNVPILSSGFEVETEMTLTALDRKFIIKEVPVDYKDRKDGSVSKLNTFKDGINVLKTILEMYKNYKPKSFFRIIAVILLVLGLIITVPVIIEYIKTKTVSTLPLAIFGTGFMILSALSLQCGLILDMIVKSKKEKYEINLINFKK